MFVVRDAPVLPTETRNKRRCSHPPLVLFGGDEVLDGNASNINNVRPLLSRELETLHVVAAE